MPPLTSSNPPTSLTSSNSSNHIHIQTLTPPPHPPHHQHRPTRNSHLDQGRRTEQKSNNLFKLSNLVSRSCVRNKFNNINQPTRIFLLLLEDSPPKGTTLFPCYSSSTASTYLRIDATWHRCPAARTSLQSLRCHF